MNGILSFLNSSVGLGIIRNIVLSAGSILVANGYFTQAQWSDVVGAIVIIAGVVLSALANRSAAQAKAVVQAVNDHPSLTIIPAEQTGTGKPVVSIAPSASNMGIPVSNVGAQMNPNVHLQ